jgi:perosamine synthetase
VRVFRVLKAVKDRHTIKIPLMKPIFNRDMEKAAVNALHNERFVLGESVYRFEEEFAKHCGVDYAVSTNSGTDALQIALAALRIARGNQVITTPASFVASSNVILHVDATPVFADIDLETYTISPEHIRQAMGRETKAVIPVHLYGYPADMDSINELAAEHGLFVVEDACQAHGAAYKGRTVGSLGDIACFSFYPSKNMTVAGDGGMLVTNNEKLATDAAKLRDCGRSSRYVHDSIGYTARLNTVNAAIGRVQLKHLEEWNEQRRRKAQIYDHLLSDIDDLLLPPKGDNETKPVYHLYVIRTSRRDGLKAWLESKGIQCLIHYPIPIHLQPIYQDMYGFQEGRYPKSEELCRTCLSIPLYPDLTKRELTYISDTIHAFF